MENHNFSWQIHYKWPFSIAMLNYQRVTDDLIWMIWEEKMGIDRRKSWKRSTMPQKWMVYAWRVIDKMTNMSGFGSMIHWGRKTHHVGQSEQRSASAMKKPTSCGKPAINLPWLGMVCSTHKHLWFWDGWWHWVNLTLAGTDMYRQEVTDRFQHIVMFMFQGMSVTSSTVATYHQPRCDYM